MVDVEGFIVHWGLDEAAWSVLSQLSPETQERVLTAFAPRGNTRDVTGLFYGFCKSIEGKDKIDQLRRAAVGRPEPAPQQEFEGGLNTPAYPAEDPQAQWGQEDPEGLRDQLGVWCSEKGLDASCLETLLSLEPSHRDSVLSGFAPKGDTKNPTGLFMSYVRSMSSGPKGAGKAGKRPAPGGPVGAPNVFAAPFQMHGPAAGKGKSAWAAPAGKGKSAGRGLALAGASAAPLSEDEIVDFVQTWGLDGECVGMLMERPPDVQRELLNSFNPKAGTRNMKHLFLGFLNSLSRAKGNVAANHVAAQPQPGMWAPLVQQTQLHEFGQVWGLDEECLAIVASQTQEVQLIVLERFQPKQGTRDIKGLLMGFLKSLNSGPKGGPPQKGGGAGHFKGGGPTMSWGGKGGCQAKGKGGWEPLAVQAFGVPVAKRAAPEAGAWAPPVPDHEIGQFVQMWGLDEECSMMVRDQPPEVQRHVIDRFKPKADTKDIASLFKGFLKSFVYGPGHNKRVRVQ